MAKLAEVLSQEKYKDDNGHDLDASEVEHIGTYKHVCDGFYSWRCSACGHVQGSRSCGWSIAGMVEACPQCGTKNLLLRNDIDWINDRLSEVGSLDCEVRKLKREKEELEQYRDSEPAKLTRRIGQLESQLEQIKNIVRFK